MKIKSLFLFLFLFSTYAYSQFLPNNLTEEEKSLLENYRRPQAVDGIVTPPSFPVRTMAEWEELRGIMITWSSHYSILSQIVDYAQEEGIVYIVTTNPASVESYLNGQGVPLTNVEFIDHNYNTIWCRDYGPWSIYKSDVDTMSIVDWIYNRPRPLDDIIPEAVAQLLGVDIYSTTDAPYDLVHSGGNFMTDGHGTGFSSNLILNENPEKTEAEIDDIMNQFMGIDRYIKMTTLPYDVIHHIDMHMKLLDEETLLVGQYPPWESDGPQIEANLQYILNNFSTCYGRDYKVVRIPMPPDAYGDYPAQGGDYRTYTNSLIVNKTVIVPTYDEFYDTTALRIYREAMPGYNVVGIECNSIIPSLGAIHCITKEIGAEKPILISHANLRDTEEEGPYEINAEVKSVDGIASVELFWTTDTTAGYQTITFTETANDSFTVSIPEQTAGTEVFYYITAHSNAGKTYSKPPTAPAGFIKFKVNDSVPVELVSFTAEARAENVYLRWQTATETNNKGFYVERKSFLAHSQNGNDWQTAGFVDGKGTTSETQNYSFTDKNLSGGKYLYRLKQVDYDGAFRFCKTVEVETEPVYSFELEQNYPNPFSKGAGGNPATTIKFTLKERAFAEIKIYNILGAEVASLIGKDLEAGRHEVVFDAGSLASGIYIYRLTAGNFVSSKRMNLIK